MSPLPLTPELYAEYREGGEFDPDPDTQLSLGMEEDDDWSDQEWERHVRIGYNGDKW